MRKAAFTLAVGGALLTSAPLPAQTPLAMLAGQVAAAPAAKLGQTTTLSIAPAKPSVPALQHRLTVSAMDQKPGNAAVLLNRAALIAHQGGAGKPEAAKLDEELRKTLDQPADALAALEKQGKLADLRKRFKERTEGPLFEVRRAALMRECDFLLPIRDGKRFVEVLLPEIQECRNLGRWLESQARLDLVRGDFAGAERAMRTGMALGRHVGSQRVIISCLVGSAIEAQVHGVVEQWVQTPGSPNLYWALANVPSPWIDYSEALDMERNLLPLSLPGYDPDRPPPAGDPWWKECLGLLLNDMTMMTSGETKINGGGGLAVAVVTAYPKSRAGLLKSGWKVEEVEKMSGEEVVLRYSLDAYREVADENFKHMRLPYAESAPIQQEFEAKFKTIAAEREAIPLAALVLPALARVSFVERRGHRQRTMLRLVELLRWSAAEKGEWPSSLQDLPAAAPADPVTGKPFEFAREGNKITLDAPLLPFMNPQTQGFRYVLLLSEIPPKAEGKKAEEKK